MEIWAKFLVLFVAAYLLGSIPMSFLVAKARGVDLRKQGSQQVGGGNVWRTTSRTLGILVGIYDFSKGVVIAICAWQWGLEPGLQFLAAIGAIIGHNWPLFLRFHGGRGIATTLGLTIFMPIINRGDITFWPLIICGAVGIGSLIYFRRTPVPVLLALIAMPIASAVAKEPWLMILGYVGILVVAVIKRLTAQASSEKPKTGMAQVLFNRFFHDRDVADRAAWVHRKAADK